MENTNEATTPAKKLDIERCIKGYNRMIVLRKNSDIPEKITAIIDCPLFDLFDLNKKLAKKRTLKAMYNTIQRIGITKTLDDLEHIYEKFDKLLDHQKQLSPAYVQVMILLIWITRTAKDYVREVSNAINGDPGEKNSLITLTLNY